MKQIVVYVHGKGGSAEEAEHYSALFPDSEVLGFDYRAQTPWEAREEFPRFFAAQRARCGRLTLIANSIGAYFSLLSLDETLVDAAYLISPVVDMEKLIGRMMTWANVTERELAERQEIPTTFGETLSWRYLCDVREHPVTWRVPTRILYGERDELTDMRTITEFAEKSGAALTVCRAASTGSTRMNSCGFWTGGSRHDGDRTPAPAGYVYGRGRGADHRIRQQTGGMACAMLKPAAFGFLRVLQKLP